jgi:hypothetical protein
VVLGHEVRLGQAGFAQPPELAGGSCPAAQATPAHSAGQITVQPCTHRSGQRNPVVLPHTIPATQHDRIVCGSQGVPLDMISSILASSMSWVQLGHPVPEYPAPAFPADRVIIG